MPSGNFHCWWSKVKADAILSCYNCSPVLQIPIITAWHYHSFYKWRLLVTTKIQPLHLCNIFLCKLLCSNLGVTVQMGEIPWHWFFSFGSYNGGGEALSKNQHCVFKSLFSCHESLILNILLWCIVISQYSMFLLCLYYWYQPRILLLADVWTQDTLRFSFGFLL